MKKGICFALTLLLVMSGTVFGFAGTMQFTGTETKMSLADTQKMMLTSSTAIQTADYNLKANKAKTKGYYEDVNNLVRLQNAVNEANKFGVSAGLSTPSKTQREMAALASEFATAQTQRNYDAEVNKIVRDTVDTYFKLLQAKENVRIGQDNVTVQEKLYQNTQSKFKLGVVSKQDVLKAEVGLNEAKVNAEKAQNAYDSARMGFNILIGFDLMQNVALTDTLQQATMSAVTLDQAIEKALQNRNEITGAAFAVKLAELTLKETGNTVSKTSSRYMEASANLLNAQDNLKNAPKAIEMDVRNKYTAMMQKRAEVDLAKLNVDNAKETYRLANLQYDAGMATLTDTQQAQLGAVQVELAYVAAMLDYNLAIIDYEQAMTVGTTSIPF